MPGARSDKQRSSQASSQQPAARNSQTRARKQRPKEGREMGNGARPGGKRARAHKRTSATAGTDTVTDPETTHRNGGEWRRSGSGGLCVLGIGHIQNAKGPTGMRCRVERAGEENSQAGSRRWSRQSLLRGLDQQTKPSTINQCSRNPEGIAPRHRRNRKSRDRLCRGTQAQAGVDNGWETEERRAGLTSLRRLRRGRVGRGVRARVALLVGFPLGGRFVLRRPSSGSGSAPFRWRARSRAPERG